jgi:hypothetical protein
LLLVDIVADQIDGCVRASAGRREGAYYSLAEFAGAEVERQKTVRRCVCEQDLLAHGGECAAECGDETGLADAASQGEYGKDGGPDFLLADGDFGLILTGLLEDTLEGVPASGHALTRVLESICN